MKSLFILAVLTVVTLGAAQSSYADAFVFIAKPQWSRRGSAECVAGNRILDDHL